MDKESPVKRKKGFYSISVVAKMFEVHQQTVRMYEKEGLLSPKRSAGNTRLFSEEDVDRLEEIIYLTHKMGINLAGVEMILKLKKKVAKLQEEMNNVLNAAREQLDEESSIFKEDTKVRAQRLLAMKKEGAKKETGDFIDLDEVASEVIDSGVKKRETRSPKAPDKNSTDNQDLSDDWQIEYDDEK